MIHPTAIVEAGADIGKNVGIGPFSYVADDVVIGDGCQLGPHVTVLPYTTVGADGEIHASAVLGDRPQDLGFDGGPSYLRIGSRCVIREGVTMHRGTKPETATEIGDGCFFMANSHVGHNVKMGDGVILANGVLLAGYAEVGDGAFLSGNTVVHQFTKMGRLAMLGGLSGISKDLPPFCTTLPSSKNTVVGLNVLGLRRSGMPPPERVKVKKAFKLLYRSGLNVPNALAQIQETLDGPALEFCEFAERSERGLCGGVEVRDG